MPETFKEFTAYTALFNFFRSLLHDSSQLYLPHNSKQIQTKKRGFQVFALVFGV